MVPGRETLSDEPIAHRRMSASTVIGQTHDAQSQSRVKVFPNLPTIEQDGYAVFSALSTLVEEHLALLNKKKLLMNCPLKSLAHEGRQVMLKHSPLVGCE